eukprot:m.14580 g.14580  ORF g.14580 m.14580 type:complete len:377 (-) comp5145_c0_seq1:246-1376(-)
MHDPEDDLYWVQAPVENGGVIWVDFRHNLYKLAKINTQEEKSFIDFEIVYIWTDYRLKGYTAPALPLKLWGPRPQLENGLDDMVEVQTQFLFLDRANGRLKRSIRYTGSVDTPMPLKDFPFDTISVMAHFDSTSTFISWDWTEKGQSKVPTYKLRRVREEGEGISLAMRWPGNVTEWQLHGIEVEVIEKPPNAQGEIHISCDLLFHLSRKASYYFWKALMPLYLLTILSLSTFYFEVDNLSDRISTVSTFFLAAFAMLYVVGESLPKTDFLTSIDKVIVITTILLMMLGVFAVALFEESKKDFDRAREMNDIILYVVTAGYVLFNLFYFLPSYLNRRASIKKIEAKGQAVAQKGIEFGFEKPEDTWPFYKKLEDLL